MRASQEDKWSDLKRVIEHLEQSSSSASANEKSSNVNTWTLIVQIIVSFNHHFIDVVISIYLFMSNSAIQLFIYVYTSQTVKMEAQQDMMSRSAFKETKK